MQNNHYAYKLHLCSAENVLCRMHVETTGWLVLQGIFVLRIPENVTMSPFWN